MVLFLEMLIVKEIEAENDFLAKNHFFKMISRYRPFPQNVGSLEDKAEEEMFLRCSQNMVLFLEMLIVKEIEPENDFLGKNQFFKNDLKISFFPPKCC